MNKIGNIIFIIIAELIITLVSFHFFNDYHLLIIFIFGQFGYKLFLLRFYFSKNIQIALLLVYILLFVRLSFYCFDILFLKLEKNDELGFTVYILSLYCFSIYIYFWLKSRNQKFVFLKLSYYFLIFFVDLLIGLTILKSFTQKKINVTSGD